MGLAPVIRWSGSKRKQADKITSMFPKFDRYFEPFIGGGSVLGKTAPSDAICGDICKPLIDLWNVIKNDPKLTSNEYMHRWEKMQSDGHNVFYDIRREFNKNQNPHDLLFLSRTCVNGLIRFNRKGEFNGSLHLTRKGIHPSRLDPIIHRWSEIIQTATFIHSEYSSTTESATGEDFIYLDPPYYNTNQMYYGKINYDYLCKYLEDLCEKGIKYALSYDGKRDSNDFTVKIPSHLYKRHIYIESGVSTFKKIMESKTETVKESFYLNY